MGDSITAGIDRFFGALDRVTDTLNDGMTAQERVEQHAQHMKEKHEARTAGAKALARVRYKVEEITDAESGKVSFDVVSVDRTERVECNSRSLANKVHRALEALP